MPLFLLLLLYEPLILHALSHPIFIKSDSQYNIETPVLQRSISSSLYRVFSSYAPPNMLCDSLRRPLPCFTRGI